MGTRLFVGNLPYSCTEEDIRGLFEPRWTVADVRLVTDRETGRPRGFGFVQLDGEASADAIGELDGSELGGRRIAVREAHERPSKPPRGRPSGRSEPAVDTLTRRGFVAGPIVERRANVRRYEAPPPAHWESPEKGQQREQRREKGDQEEPEW